MGKLYRPPHLLSFDTCKRLMNSILVANSVSSEQYKIKKMIDQEYNVSCIGSPNEPELNFDEFDLVLLDHNFTDNSGLDFLKQIVKESCIPVLMITPADDFQCAIESIRVGAFNYIVKTGVFLELINISVKEAINRFNELEHMKQTITDLRKRVAEMETRLRRHERIDGKELPVGAKSLQKKEIEKPTIIQEIVTKELIMYGARGVTIFSSDSRVWLESFPPSLSIYEPLFALDPDEIIHPFSFFNLKW